jgi:hypothetical protein
VRVENNIEVVALSRNMHLIIPKHQRHEWKPIKFKVVFLHFSSKVSVVVADISRVIVHLITEVLSQAFVLVELIRQFRHRFIHQTDVVDWVSLHHPHYSVEITGPL